MFTPEFSNQFKRSYKLMIKRGANPKLLEKAISLICSEEPLPYNYKEHNLIRQLFSIQRVPCFARLVIDLQKGQ